MTAKISKTYRKLAQLKPAINVLFRKKKQKYDIWHHENVARKLPKYHHFTKVLA